MPLARTTLKEGTLLYTAGLRARVELARDNMVTALVLKLAVTITILAAANTAAAVQKGGIWGVISRLEVVLNNTETYLSLPGWALPWLAWLWTGQFPEQQDTLGDGVAVNPPLFSTLVIPFLQPASAKPHDTVLDCRRARNVDLWVTWAGAATSISSGATGFTANPVLTVTAERMYPLASQVDPEARPIRWQRDFSPVDIAATNAALRINISTGYVYRGFVCVYDDDGAMTAGALTGLKLRSGQVTYFDLEEDELRQIARKRYGLIDRTAPLVYSRGQNSLLGFYWVDLLQDGRLTECLDTTNWSELYFEANIVKPAGVSTLYIFPWAFFPPAKPESIAA